MSVRSYQVYKESGVQWLGRIPAHWDVVPPTALFTESKERAHGSDQLLSATQKYGVIPLAEFEELEQRQVTLAVANLERRKHVEIGDFVISMRSMDGGLERARAIGSVRSSYSVLKPGPNVDGRFYGALLKSGQYIQALRLTSNFIRDGQDMNFSHFRRVRLPTLPVQEQAAIADFLDRETARIDELIEKKKLFQQSVARRIEALVDVAISDPKTPRIRFEHVTCRVQRPAVLSEHDELVRLGLYNRGRGIFKKPAADEEGMGDSDFFFVKEGDLILSGQFAWEGAVALASADEEGCVVSHRYPIYRGKSGTKSAYLVGLLRSSFGEFLLNEASRGAAGRNRPLNVRRLEKEKIPVPGKELQEAIERAVILDRQLKAMTHQSIERLEELRAALITAAVTGQIEVRDKLPAASSKPGRSKFRVIVGAEIVRQHQGNPKFGRVKLQKELYLAEAHLGIHELQGNYLREAAGPLDRALIEETERGLEAAGFYRASQRDGTGTAVIYTPLARAGQHKAELETMLGPKADELRSLIAKLRDLDRREVEAVATLYAVWNDALMDGAEPDDAMVINGVLTEWHTEKGEKFSTDDLARWLGWMRRHSLTPRGQGPRTDHTRTRDMFA